MKEKESLTQIQKQEIMLDYQFIQPMPGILEVPADFILYRVFRVIGFDQVVTDEEIRSYSQVLGDVYSCYRGQLSNYLAINYPSGENYHKDLFTEVELENHETGFALCPAKGKLENELRDYRLARLEVFKKQQGIVFTKVVALADQKYRLKRRKQLDITTSVSKEPASQKNRGKKLLLSRFIKFKFRKENN